MQHENLVGDRLESRTDRLYETSLDTCKHQKSINLLVKLTLKYFFQLIKLQ